MKDGKVFWEIKQAGESLVILIPSRNLTFLNVVPQDSQIRASKERLANDGQTLEKYTLDILFSETKFLGKFETPSINFEVTGKLSDAFRQYRKKLARLRKIKSSAEGQIAKLSQSNDKLEDANHSLQGDLKITEKDLEKNQKLVRKQKQDLETIKKKYKIEIIAIKKAAPQIDVRSLQSSYKVRFTTELKSSPREQARSYLKLSKNEPVIVLVEIPRSDWAIIATSKGKLGYIKSAFLEVGRSINQPPIIPPKPPTGPSKVSQAPNIPIVISEPSWDPGQKGSRMTIAAAGFMTLTGFVNAKQPVQSLKINQKQIPVSPDGRFQTLLNISSSQRMEIVAVLINGRSEKLTFDLVVRSP